MNRGPRTVRGYLLLPVAIAIALIGVIAFLISSESAIEVEMTANELQASRADYVAQAGLQHALRQLAQQGCGPYTDLTNVTFGNDEYDTSLSHDLGGTAAYTVNVDQDAWIRDDFPTNNYASDTKMHIRSEGGVTERPMLRYDLSTVPAKAAILSARAWFYVNKEHSEGPVDIHLITTDWLDTNTTWDSMGDEIDSRVLASIPTEPGTGVWISVNLTAQVQAWINGEDNFGITINTDSAGVHSEYLSSESAFPPYLEVIVGSPPTSPAKLESTSKIDGGAAAIIKRADIMLYQSPPSFSQVRVETGAGKDVVLDSFYSSRNHGDYRLDVDSIGTLEHSLIQFDLSAIPTGARIQSARLELYHTITNGTPVDPTIDLYRVTQDWVEGTQTGGGTADGATWNTWDGSSNWTQAGGDYYSLPISSSEISVTTDDWESWGIEKLVQGWVDGTYPNQGILLKGAGSVDISFASKEDSDASLRPRLSISYACACGEICATSQSSGNLLMVVVSPSVLVDEDQKAKDLFESWGYTVSVISESANQSSYDNAVAANDVVFISEAVNSNSVGTKLVNAPIGVVSQDRDYNLDLGLATGGTLKVGIDVDITDTDHFITRPFPAGTLQMYTAGMEQLVTTGALTADQQPLAQIGGDASLVVLEKGAAMEGGGTAAGRRVILPLGTRYRFNWNHLNANGRLLVQRALEWGADDSPGTPAGSLLLVVPSPSSLNAQDSSKQALIESWGYSVTLIDDSDSQANIDAAAAANDVIYVSGSISGGALADKLTGSPTPIVNEFSGKLDNFGFSSATGDTVTIDSFTATNAFHYIGDPFSGSGVTHFTSSLTMPVVSGTVAPGIGAAASIGTLTAALPTLDTGAERWDGNPAPARRVHLPFGAATASQLTDDGKTLMRRAIEWSTSTPDSATKLLFVVQDPASLTAYETAKQSLIESWGYSVNLIDDADSATNFVAAFGVHDVVYVSGEISDSAIGSKLIKTSIGVVNEQIALHDELLMSTSAGTNPFNNIFVIDNTHYITEGINTGWHNIATVNQPLNALVGTLAPGMTNLAEVWISGANYDFGLAVVDTGGQLNGGEIAAGRRVQLPWGTAGFDFSALNANGQNLMKRAIEWAGGAEIDLSPLAHWKLDETSGPTAVDSEGGHDGTWTNGPIPAPGAIDGGLEFDGNDDTIVVPHDDTLNLTEDMTFIAWVYSDGFGVSGPYDLVISKGTVATDYAYYFGTLDDEIIFGFSDGVYREFTTPNLDLSIGTWHHIVATFSNTGDSVKLYHNGVEVLSETTTYSPSANAHDLYIGSSEDGADWDGVLDDVRIYDRVLSQDEITDLFNTVSLPGTAAYTETYDQWLATSDNTWQTVDLSGFGVPADAVVEVVISNSKDKNERWGGVRAVGSSLERRLRLHEAEGGGTDSITMHVQANANSEIQHYAEKKAEVSFRVVGYWIGASYVELFDTFTADSSNSWVVEDVSDEGLGANQVAEIAIVNTDQGAERLAGLRTPGSGYQRHFNLHEAESGGVEALTLMVTTNASAEVEAYAQDTTDVDFYVLGFWSTAPGSYTEFGGVQGQAVAADVWHEADPALWGVPPDSVAQFVMINEVDNFEREMGMRAVGSTLDRVVDLQEAEEGGAEAASMHVNIDSNNKFEIYVEAGTTERFFYPVGWWVLSP